ncbi:nucleotide pyrophosphohydrolase [Candidatus Magnetominusculus xianensis]|uniref:Nucleotide pyrophosphohydrolase n=1 Tax=Candidatus Magnetominusculus xianensis TaxID=1748249 RepID=A0ABR5SE01_9BACT|nr:nucleotide pyrophosphohydrolase [Candidatus Magnetominusculus xianensis]KWT82471.1 nucleotide pyrophosphohydrolase [Candidatus Magnetominusculus xianensis]MBF0403191.1 nucleotide pyrophosphohydrolase [Nitrospirota bacterium]
MTIAQLTKALATFAGERDWGQFHSPKNLAMALSVEVAEIVELFQWTKEEDSCHLTPEKLSELKDEIGDVMIYLTNLASKFNIDPLEAAAQKFEKNKKKYPADLVKGKSAKYTEYGGS